MSTSAGAQGRTSLDQVVLPSRGGASAVGFAAGLGALVSGLFASIVLIAAVTGEVESWMWLTASLFGPMTIVLGQAAGALLFYGATGRRVQFLNRTAAQLLFMVAGAAVIAGAVLELLEGEVPSPFTWFVGGGEVLAPMLLHMFGGKKTGAKDGRKHQVQFAPGAGRTSPTDGTDN